MQVRKFKEKQERERWKKEKERKKAASEILERHRGNKDSMKAIRRNLNNTKSADKSREILDSEERKHRDALEREKDRKNGLRDQVCTAVSREAWATLPESSSRLLPATLAPTHNLAHASLKTAVQYLSAGFPSQASLILS